MILCKYCHQTAIIKHGLVCNKQYYKYHNYDSNFVPGDEHHKHATALQKALSRILCSSGNASCGFLDKLFRVARPQATQAKR